VAVHDEEGEVLVVLALGPLPEVRRVLERERVEPERLAEDLDIGRARAVDVEPEEPALSKPPLEGLSVEGEGRGARQVEEVRRQSQRFQERGLARL
jgi:hypothetical protein